jgi:hypothetical protein
MHDALLLLAAAGAGAGYKAPLTRLVCTPCYRAPEVVMSRGGYTSAIDMWSTGCIFGELLQRMARIGIATTPHLQVSAECGAGSGVHQAGTLACALACALQRCVLLGACMPAAIGVPQLQAAGGISAAC